jgi:hypothetical protein
MAYPDHFSRDGNRLIVDHVDPLASTWVADKWVVWDTNTRERIADLPVRGPAIVALSPSGKLVAQYSNPRVTLWSESTGKSLPLKNSFDHSGLDPVRCVLGLLCLTPFLIGVAITGVVLLIKRPRTTGADLQRSRP